MICPCLFQPGHRIHQNKKKFISAIISSFRSFFMVNESSLRMGAHPIFNTTGMFLSSFIRYFCPEPQPRPQKNYEIPASAKDPGPRVKISGQQNYKKKPGRLYLSRNHPAGPIAIKNQKNI